MIYLRPATPADVHAIFARLSDNTADELEAAGYDKETVEFVYANKAAQGDAAAMICDDKPVMVFGVNDFGHYYSMWSAMAPAYYALGAAGIRATRWFLDGMEFDAPLLIVSASRHPHAERWFNVLGFEHRADHGGQRVFTRVEHPVI